MSIQVSSSVQESTTMQHNLKLHPDPQGNATAHESGIETTEMQEDSPFVAKNRKCTMSVTQTETVTSLQNFQYDQAKIREILSHMVIVHELPFRFSEYELYNLLMRAATPHFQKISRTTLKNDCIASFEMEKKRIMEELKGVKRVSITTDLWTSG